MIKHTDNPAGRLFLILKKAKKIDKQTKMKNAWAEILGVESKDSAELLRKIGKVNQLPFDIKKGVKSIDDQDHELYLRGLGKVENALGNINFNSSWNGFLNIIDDTTVASLEFTSNLLSRENGEHGLSQKDIDNLLDITQKFKKELVDSDVPEPLQKFILERLNAIESAIHDYKISGVKPIETEIERSVGSLVMRRGIYNKDKSWSKKFFNLISKIGTIINFANDTQTLLGSAKKLLTE